MMTQKCTYQKLYEKLRLAQLFQTRVMMATSDGEPGLYLCADGGKGVVPIARLLTQEAVEQLAPDFEKSEMIHEFFETMEIVDPRDEDSDLDDWNDLVGFGFEEAFMTGVDDLSKPSTGDEQ
jgi:hypothetical protein